MEKRDLIAVEYMKSILNGPRFSDYVEDSDIMKSIAQDAYKMADVMMQESGSKPVKVVGKRSVKS